MAQITIKGFVSKDVEYKDLGKEKIRRARLTVVDDTRSKNVGFWVDFWKDNAELLKDIKKGDCVIVKAYVEDNSFEKDGMKKYGIQYTGFAIKKCARDGGVDLDKVFDSIE